MSIKDNLYIQNIPKEQCWKAFKGNEQSYSDDEQWAIEFIQGQIRKIFN